MSKQENLNPKREAPLKTLTYTAFQGKHKKQQVLTENQKRRVCVACCEPLQNTSYIRCCECATDNVVLCHACFYMGAEIGAHKRGHKYEVKNPRACPVFGSEGELWGCEMDMGMLAAFKDYQDGNWEPECIDTTKVNAAETVHRHIDECFLKGHIGGYVLQDKFWPVLKEVDQTTTARQADEDKHTKADGLVANTTEFHLQDNVVENDPDTGSVAQIDIEDDGRVVLSGCSEQDCCTASKNPSKLKTEFGNKENEDAKTDKVTSSGVRPNNNDLVAAAVGDHCPMQLLKRTPNAASVKKPDINMLYSGGLTTAQMYRLRAERPHHFFHHYPSHTLPGESSALLNKSDCADIGYEPKRDDFEEEYANDAEKLLSTIRMRPSTEAQTAYEIAFLQDVKLARMRSYNRALARRRAAHSVAREHVMLKEFFSYIRKCTKDECSSVFSESTFPTKDKEDEYRPLFRRMRQVTTQEELASLVEKIGKMETLKEEIVRLQTLQRNGETEIKGRLTSDTVKSSANRTKDRK